jgi:hypothetical protein
LNAKTLMSSEVGLSRLAVTSPAMTAIISPGQRHARAEHHFRRDQEQQQSAGDAAMRNSTGVAPQPARTYAFWATTPGALRGTAFTRH